jgi:ornithine carbamoyltransferase
MARHFLDLRDFSKAELQSMLDMAAAMKAGQWTGQPLAGKTVGMIFEKPSTRTRVSFEVGISQLGGTPLVLSTRDMQLGRGEPLGDTAQVLSRFMDAIMIRCLSHETLEGLAEYASVPVINGLTDRSHPCQIMADLQTMIERLGSLSGQIVSWFGDGNNVAASWIEAAVLFGFELRLAGPPAYRPDQGLLDWAAAQGGRIHLMEDAEAAASGATLLVTDVWVSMGDEEGTRLTDFSPYQVTEKLMGLADPSAIFMHCLPAQRGLEVAAEVIDGPQSVVWDEAENRLHAQKAILAFLLGEAG